MPTSEEWMKTLGKGLDARHSRLTLANDYYQGRVRSVFRTSKYRETFGRMFSGLSDNFAKLVVDSVEERLTVEGFRLPGEPAKPEDERTAGDQDAWRIWQDNQLDADSQVAHTEALIKEQSYGLVWGNSERAVITIEDPLQTIVATAAGNRRVRLAGYKRWIDDSGFLFATLYLPDRIEKYQSTKKVDPETLFLNAEQTTWEKRERDDEAWPLANPLGVVPLVPLINSPRLDGSGESEIAPVIPIQDAINKLVSDMLVAAEFGAFRQRYVTGIEIPNDPETGKPIEPFKIGADRLLWSENEKAAFGEFSQTDLSPYVSAIAMLIQHVASITRTPPHYFLANMGNFPSGEALMAAETGLVKKARRKMRHFGEAWEEIIRLAFLVMGDRRATITDSETIWGDPESRNEAVITDAVIKRYQAGLIPWDQANEDLGYTPQQIQRFKKLRNLESLPQFVPMDSIKPVQPQSVTNVAVPAAP